MTNLIPVRLATAFTLALSLVSLTVGHADPIDQFGLHKAEGEAKFASGAGDVIFLAAGTLMPLLHKGKDSQ